VSEPVTCFAVGRREGGRRLDRFLHARIPGLSRTRVQRAIRERVSVSWAPAARPATRVRAAGEVRIAWTPVVEELLDLPLPLLAAGQGWIAVDKPAGIPVHPAHRVRENSLIRMLRRQVADPGLRLAHRLDRETTGVLLVARDAATAARLAAAFARRAIHKEYLALVRGVVADEAGTIDLPIGDAAGSAVFVRRAAGCGQPAHTDFRVERRLPAHTLLRLFPRTGRRHQLRVHLAAIGHPVLGDILYGRDDADYLDLVRGVRDARREEGGPRRQLLHCARLVFADPHGGGTVEVCAALPADFAFPG